MKPIDHIATVRNLYGNVLYMTPEDPTADQAKPDKVQEEKKEAISAVVWKEKAASRILFIIREDEFRNKELTSLLKKIVASIEIPFEEAGFWCVERKVWPGRVPGNAKKYWDPF